MLRTWLYPPLKAGTPQERTIHPIGMVFRSGTESGTDSFSEGGCVTLVMDTLVCVCVCVMCMSMHVELFAPAWKTINTSTTLNL